MLSHSSGEDAERSPSRSPAKKAKLRSHYPKRNKHRAEQADDWDEVGSVASTINPYNMWKYKKKGHG